MVKIRIQLPQKVAHDLQFTSDGVPILNSAFFSSMFTADITQLSSLVFFMV